MARGQGQGLEAQAQGQGPEAQGQGQGLEAQAQGLSSRTTTLVKGSRENKARFPLAEVTGRQLG